IITDYFFVKRREYKAFEEMTFKSVNWVSIAAWGVGVAFAQVAPGITPLNALLGTAVIYFVFMKVADIKKIKEAKVISVDY
ncbi:hypothetical protein NXY55_27005, partial [Aeromonas veronii]|nr:hypothetical protein [Aeromonas veronii]